MVYAARHRPPSHLTVFLYINSGPASIHTKPVSSGMPVAAMHALQIWMPSFGTRKIWKTNMLICLLKTRYAPPHPRVAAVGRSWLERTHFQKYMYMQGAVCDVKQRIVFITLLFCTMTNKCTIISQIITPLHVSTLSCHPQGAYNKYLAKLNKYFKWPTNAQLF